MPEPEEEKYLYTVRQDVANNLFLRAYELDTGLRRLAEAGAIEGPVIEGIIGTRNRMRDLAHAEAQGRLVILPEGEDDAESPVRVAE